MSDDIAGLRVALVHYWLVGCAGGEKVLGALAEMFPQADLFALVADPATLPPALRDRKLTTSFLQHLPGSRRWHRHFLALHPFALEQLDVSGYDLIISSESGPAKGVLAPSSTCHICYCHSPMRYLWDMYHQYRAAMNPLTRLVFSVTAHYVRQWDVISANRVDYFVANSSYVASRIRRNYRREADVIHPPVEISCSYLAPQTEDYYLVVSRLSDYKRIDIAIEACNRLGRKLRIVGAGEQLKRLRKLAGSSVQFLGYLQDTQLHEQYAHCRALLFPGEEDFGIVPVEAQAFGRPVIAFGRGGIVETVIAPVVGAEFEPSECTGIFFPQQTAESLVDAICYFERHEHRFSARFIRSHALQWSPERFKREMADHVSRSLSDFRTKPGRSSACYASACRS